MLPRGSIRTNLLLGLPALLLAAAIVAVAASWSGDFFAAGNLGNLVNRVLPLSLAALGQAFVLFAGRIDLSVGSVISLSTAILATTSTSLGWAAVPLVLVAGLACGALNAAGVIYLRINPLIMTLASSAIVKGAALILMPTPGGEVDYTFYDAFYGQDLLVGWPLAVILLAFLGAFLLFGFTRFGRRIYALGSDDRAAYANGVDVRRVEWSVFLASGFFAAAAGVAVGIKILSGDPLIGDSFTLDAIAAAVLGGVALQGGRGAVPGVLAGSIALVLIANAFNLLELDPNLQQIAKGLIFVVALMLFMRGGVRRTA
ncbi:ABC transporter permease [Prosthecomicrobium pneumaticum]|uniref:Ribose transport system permease protein n=1 Tax=Prosthecomicrobium pneumaticum TaxID=81895 RepID=A0A7W9CUA2_9HYPH|nr:ABC transporter permease [Prosthecomicrobium pneumaticum]MBB5751656.1 ribose transport system permease protein [Prosthecomicrobium pneumaticum]